MSTPVLAPAEPVTATLTPLQRWRAILRDGRDALRAEFETHADTKALLHGHARLVDRVVRGVWSELRAPSHLALLAVGGFGRGELYPHSDVDVLVLLTDPADDTVARFVEQLIGLLWDVGLE
ncbi:MAG TPA: DUF294 nucleotidyltransferase-like domain-containing protein, partial [Casimicrobiaceae bacterium]|nr:DUF294 nucleotidyltransferase-like domain-containing protein [Casimicrobiaceae bacterium]